jgi:hypothetical protein
LNAKCLCRRFVKRSLCQYSGVGKRAVTSWAGANGLLRRMLFGTPFETQIVGTVAGHIGNGKFRVDLSGAAGDIPAVHFVSPKILGCPHDQVGAFPPPASTFRTSD